jgi:hypothetical protein
LKDLENQPIDNPYNISPELRIGDVDNLDSAEVLDKLKHRATTSIYEQYCEGLRGNSGDHAFIINIMPFDNSPLSERFKNGFTLFLDEDQYGDSMKVTDPAKFDRIMADLSVVCRCWILCSPKDRRVDSQAADVHLGVAQHLDG